MERMDFQLAADSPSTSVRCTFADEALVVAEEGRGRSIHVRFSEIRTIHLWQTLGAYVMRIEAEATRPVTLRSRRVLGTRVEDLLDDYAAVARGLHALHRGYPEIRFVGGSSGLYWVGWALVPTVVVLAGLSAWMLLAGDAPKLAGSLVAVCVLGLLGAVSSIRQGRARPYDPSAPPPSLIPR